ncbi:FAD-dependent oxidoreductase [Nocardia sp. NPDC051570]|uniref:FAD-dependent oxidoreductase n=1 Tax=Nocardia sp. NPDC051570 TaxID=3364324 RepID=UPI0037BA8D10
MGKSVLISGAGVAGSTAAYWLARGGFRVTVVERAAGQRSSGNPVDVKGDAVGIVERMGVLPRLREVASRIDRLVFVDTDGRVRGGIRTAAFQGSAGNSEIEVPRAELASVLLSATRDHADIRWGDAISGLGQTGNGVEVTFERGAPERFDLVIGADGLHSAVRRLSFGPETEFVRHMGMYVATLPVDRPLRGEREVVMVNSPGLSLAVHPASGNPGAAFIFHHAAVPGFDHRDSEQHKRIVTEAYADRLGSFAHYLDRVRAAEDLYFDAVSRVRLPHWSIGNITLLGDAASSLSLFGDGSTLAVIGGHTLAEELGRGPEDIPAALRRYERRHRAVVAPRARGFLLASRLLVPKSRAGITLRDTAVRLLRG